MEKQQAGTESGERQRRVTAERSCPRPAGWGRSAFLMAADCVGLGVSAAAVQLPPQVQLDRYRVQVDEHIEAQDFEAAKQAMDRIWGLNEQHGVEIPEALHFQYAEVLERVGIYDEAMQSVTRYLTLAGQDGVHYREALQLLNSVEAAKAAAEKARKKAEAVIAGMEMEFAWVSSGEFLMGSTHWLAEDDEQPLKRVRISRGFWLGRYEVTQELWQAVMGTNPSRFSGCGRCPVETVSWEDAQTFITRLNERVGENRYRLPT